MTVIAISCIGAILLAALFTMSYIKAPPDIAYVISGLYQRVVIGRASFRIPFLERLDKVNLRLISIDVKTQTSVPTREYIDVQVDAVVNVKVSSDPEKLKLAAQNFLNRDSEYIGSIAVEVLEGNMREIVGQMGLREMISDRQKFGEMVRDNARPDLEAMGLEIISFNVQNFKDENDVIVNMGVDNVEQIRKGAQIAKANAYRDVAMAEAMAAKEANDAKVAAELEIAKKQNDLAIKKAELKKESDTKLAIAEAAKSITAEEQRKLREIRSGDANIAAQEKQIELQDRAVSIRERQLEAEVKKTAEANRFAVQQQSDADLYAQQKNAEAELVKRQKNAEAEQYEKERAADAKKAVAEAEQYEQERIADAKKAMAEADYIRGQKEADVIRLKGEAEAQSIKAKGLAEAEAIEKRAVALQKLNEAGQMEMQLKVATELVKQLPNIARGVSEGYTKVGQITMYGDQTAKISGNIIDTTAQISDGLSKSLGIDLKSLLAGAFGAKLLDKNGKDR